MTASDRWAEAEHWAAMNGLPPDEPTRTPPAKISPEDYPEDSPERALAIRLPSLTGEDYREVEAVLRSMLRLQGTVDDLLDRHGPDPAQMDLMTDDWEEDEPSTEEEG